MSSNHIIQCLSYLVWLGK